MIPPQKVRNGVDSIKSLWMNILSENSGVNFLLVRLGLVTFRLFSLLQIKLNIGTQGVQELFFYEVSEIGAFMELFTVMIWLI